MEEGRKKSIYFPNLDGLRFLAFLSVFISHSALFFGYRNDGYGFNLFKDLFLVHGDLGVNFFFVLSGFLITYLLFREQDAAGDISLKAFYMRRILRIWPVYFVTLISGFFVVPWLVGLFDTTIPFAVRTPLSHVPWFAVFLANLRVSFFWNISAMVGILWSVSVEEQFYLLWPLAVRKAQRHAFLCLCAAVILVSTVFRFFVADNYDVSKYFTLSVFSDLAVGAVLAYGAYHMPSILERFQSFSRKVIVSVYASVAVLVPLKGGLAYLLSGVLHDVVYALLPLAFSVLFALIIAEQNFAERSFWKAGNRSFMTRLGRVSYGLYAYHIIALVLVFMIFERVIGQPYTKAWMLGIVACLTFAMTVVLALLSSRFIEQPFLRLKDRFTHGPKEEERGGLES